MTLEPTEYAATVCDLLEEEFPDLEIQHFEPESFFEGYFCEEGFIWGSDHFPVFFEEGRVINLETRGFYFLDHENLQFIPFPMDLAWGAVVFFIHKNGFVAEVDQHDGTFRPLFETPSPEEFKEFVKLYFHQGRLRLAECDRSPAVLEEIFVPFFQFPDDFNENFRKNRLVSFQWIKEEIDDHLEQGKVWLFAMTNMETQFHKMMRVIQDQMKPIPWDKYLFRREAEWRRRQSCALPGWDFALSLLDPVEGELTEERSNLIQKAQRLPEEAFTNWEEQTNLVPWSISYRYLGCEVPLIEDFFPFALKFSGAFFPKALEEKFNPSVHHQVVHAARHAFWGDPDYSLPCRLHLPPYLEQVEFVFLQEVASHNARTKAIDLTDKYGKIEEDHHHQLERQKMIWKRLQELEFEIGEQFEENS